MIRRVADIETVRSQYAEFPYPPVAVLEQEDPQRNLYGSFNHDLGLNVEECIDSSSLIWVPGCGTRWAVMLALQFAKTKIVASDISKASLKLQKNIANSLGIENIEFREESLLDVHYRQEFDFISCVGVLHHLPNPQLGFEVISKALKRTGTAEIMVYDRVNRRESIRMQSILKIMDPMAALAPRERFELAFHILKTANGHVDRPRELSRVIQLAEQSPEFCRELADFISNPREVYYDVPSLLNALKRVNLSPRGWRMPHLFDPAFLLRGGCLQPRFDSLSPSDSIELGHVLSGALLEVFVAHTDNERKDRKVHSGLSPRSRLRGIPRTTAYQFSPHGELINNTEWSKMTLRKNELFMDAGERRPGVSAFGRPYNCVAELPRRDLSLADFGFCSPLSNEEILRVIETAGEGNTIEGIANELQSNAVRSRDIQLKAVLELCERLVRPPFRVLALSA